MRHLADDPAELCVTSTISD